MTTEPIPNQNLPPLVEEAAVTPPVGEVSPRWSTQALPRGDASPLGSTQAHPSGPVERRTAEGSGLPELASLLAELQADRLSRQVEQSKSDDRLARIEDWMARYTGESGTNNGRPISVPNSTWYRSQVLLNRSGLPSRRESQSDFPPNRANARAFGTDNFINDSANVFPNDAPMDSNVSRLMKEWLKNAQKVISGAASRKYDGRYWDLWKREILIALREADLIKFISHNFVPPAFGTFEWHQYSAGDPMAQRFILKHLDDERAHELAYLKTAAEMWDHLLSTEESRTLNDVRVMVHEWEILKQEPSETMQAYIRRIDLLAARLMEVNRVKDQDDKLYKLLNGMGPHWAAERLAFKVTVNLQTYKEVCAILLGIAAEKGEANSDIRAGGEAHYTTGNRGNYRPMGKPRGPVSEILCRGCGSSDHHTANCPKVTLTKDENGRYPLTCYDCYKPGHTRRNCPNRAKEAGEEAK